MRFPTDSEFGSDGIVITYWQWIWHSDDSEIVGDEICPQTVNLAVMRLSVNLAVQEISGENGKPIPWPFRRWSW